MKKLTKIRLINWHYLANETITVKNNILLTGPNASGKSTILDAISYVITAGDTQFNIAANEKGKRDLRGYVKCKLGVEDKEYLRDGDVTGDIALEFYDEKEDSYFIVGVVLDAFGDLAPVKTLFYYAENRRIEDSIFVDDTNKIYSTVEFRKKNSSFDFYLTKREAKRAFRTAFGSINEDFYRMIPKALAFKPISDVKDFIYQNILEEKEIDVTSIKDAIRSYKDLESTLKLIKSKVTDLKDIEMLYEQINSIEERKNYLNYLLKLFEVESFETRKNEILTQIEVLKERKDAKNQEVNQIDKDIEELSERQRELYKSLSNNEEFKQEEYINKQINQINNELRDLDGVTERYIKRASLVKETVNRIRRTNDLPIFKDFSNVSLNNIDPLMISSTKQELISFNQDFQEQINKNLVESGRLQNQKEEVIKGIEEVRQAFQPLKQNKLRYNQDLLDIRQDIINGLKNIYNQNISVHIFAELIQIKDPVWANTVEDYLANRRFDLIVEPKYYDAALEVFARNKHKYRTYGLGLVNTQEMERYDESLPNSLGSIMTSENIDAMRYINYTCGSVIMCDSESELKKYPTAITNDGLIYRGYVVRNLRPVENRFIGNSALAEQTEYWNRRGSELRERYNEISEQILSIGEENKALKSLDLISLLQDLDKVLQFNALMKKLEDLNVKKAKMKKLSLSELEDEYKEITKQLKSKDAMKMLCVQDIGATDNSVQGLNREIDQMDSDKLKVEAELNQLLHDDVALEAKAREEYSELISQGSERRVLSDLEAKLEAEVNNFDNLVDGIVHKQVKYINTYNSNLEVGFTNIEAFLTELDKLERSELVKYEQKVRSARETAEIIFKEDFISKLRNNIVTAEAEISKINDTLKLIKFGRDSYEFIFPKSSEYAAFYDMFKSENVSDGQSIFTYDFEKQYNQQLDELFTSLSQDELNSNGAINKFTDYRTYMDYDIRIRNEEGQTMLYSKVFKEKSGGETQVPFYVAIIASFVRIYTQNKAATKDAIGLVLFDEVFDKMDSNRMKAMMDFIVTMPLQVIIACPPQRMAILQEYTDTTLVMVRKNNKAQVLPFETTDENAGEL